MKVVALISGGLDSTLAAKLIKEQGIEVVALNFKTAFCLCDRKNSAGCLNHARQVAHNLGLEIRVINITQEFLEIIKAPVFGYGSNMNPCIDCRILKLRKAKEFMHEIGASFVITGEVLGQRPMSQHKQALRIIEKESGLEGLVLRPLSARLLPETIPEKEGWINRDKLLSFNGRTRKPQIALAKEFGINDYPCPAGGCLLTDSGFARRIKDLLANEELNLNNIELLKIGRHFRISKLTKLIVGRDEKENERLSGLARDGDYLFMPHAIAGPTALGRGIFNNADLLKLSCGIVCRYCDLDGKLNTKIIYRKAPDKKGDVLEALPLEAEKVKNLQL